MMETLNQQTLKVAGSKTARYTLKINGTTVVSFDSA